MESKIVNSTNQNKTPEQKTSVSYEQKVIEKIAGIATSEISGILSMDGGIISNFADMLTNKDDDPTKGITADVGEKQVAIDLDVVCEYGKSIPQILKEAATSVTRQIKAMTGLDVVEFNMHVKDIMTKQEFDNKKKKQSSDQTTEA